MIDRITKNEMMLQMAEVVAKRAVCSRGVKVGCVITNWERDKIVAIGYNGPPRGLPHECSAVPGACGCVHAECNGLLKAPYGVGELRMYLTLSPCETCTRLILNSDVRDVTFRVAYRELSHLDLLRRAGISVNNPL